MMVVAAADQLLYGATAVAYLLLTGLLATARGGGAIRRLLVAGCGATALWAAAGAAGLAPASGPAIEAVELLRAGAWLGLLIHLVRRQFADGRRRVGLVGGAAAILVAAGALSGYAQHSSAALKLAFLGHLGVAVYGCFLADNLYRLTPPDRRWHVNLLFAAFAGIFGYDLVYYADALLYGRLSPLLASGRPVVALVTAPLLALAAARNREWRVDIHLSRDVVYHTGSLVAAGIVLFGLAIVGETVRLFGPDWGAVVELGLVTAGAIWLGALLTSGSIRSRLRHLLVDHFFTHRYDYRKEWLRCIAGLSVASDGASPAKAVIKAVADITDSPGGQLWMCDQNGSAFHWIQSWNMAPGYGAEPADSAFAKGFRGGDWVIAFVPDAPRPRSVGEARLWLAVPLNQRDRLLGYVLLLPPRAPLALDREVFDLLRVVGRQAAATAVEWQHRRAIRETDQLRDFGNRVAFAIHDMKNVAAQLQMILRNAPQAGADPEFHRDVLVTVGNAAKRIDALIGRLRQQSGERPDAVSIPLDVIAEELASIRRTRGVTIAMRHDGRRDPATVDGEVLRGVVAHLCDNAIEASDGRVEVSVQEEGAWLFIDIADEGGGMTAEFVRDRLFTPFGSTKEDGLGIGAYQARELIRGAGGDILVHSRPGRGTTMRIALPCLLPSAGCAVLPVS